MAKYPRKLKRQWLAGIDKQFFNKRRETYMSPHEKDEVENEFYSEPKPQILIDWAYWLYDNFGVELNPIGYGDDAWEIVHEHLSGSIFKNYRSDDSWFLFVDNKSCFCKNSGCPIKTPLNKTSKKRFAKRHILFAI